MRQGTGAWKEPMNKEVVEKGVVKGKISNYYIFVYGFCICYKCLKPIFKVQAPWLCIACGALTQSFILTQGHMHTY